MNNEQQKTLNSVRLILKTTGMGLGISPRFQKAGVWAGLPTAVALIFPSWVSVGLAMTVFCVMWWRTKPETWSEQLYKILSAYVPINEEAYRSLLLKMSDNTAKREDIVNWLNIESAYVERPNEVKAANALFARLPK